MLNNIYKILKKKKKKFEFINIYINFYLGYIKYY